MLDEVGGGFRHPARATARAEAAAFATEPYQKNRTMAAPRGLPEIIRRTALPRTPGREPHPHDHRQGLCVTDGDGIRVDRQEVRLVGLDAPEWDRRAKHRDGYWFNHGKRVKSALIQEIGGKHVRVSVEDRDKFGRLLGTVTCEDRDIGEWLVREGHATAAYSDRYLRVEREAREAKRGMWAHAHNFDPRAHRHRKPGKG